MANLFAVMAQKIFFPGTKVKPKNSWVESLRSCGMLTNFSVVRDNATISAVRVSCGNLPKAVAILGHPISRKGKYFYSDGSRISAYLRNSCDVVLFDFNGFGESDRIDLRYWKDAQAVVKYVKSEDESGPIILHGASFGAFHILRAYKDLPDCSAVILENMSRSLFDYWKRWPHTRILVRLLQSFPFLAIREMEVVQQLSNWSRPEIPIHGIACEKDLFTPANEMLEAINKHKGKHNFAMLMGAGHLEGPKHQHEAYLQILSSIIQSLGVPNET